MAEDRNASSDKDKSSTSDQTSRTWTNQAGDLNEITPDGRWLINGEE